MAEFISHKSPDQFHKTTYQSAEVFALADAWREARGLLPDLAARQLGIPPLLAQRRMFTVRSGFTAETPGDARDLLPEVYGLLTSAASDEDRARVQHCAAELFTLVFARPLAKRQEWWRAGYVPRTDVVTVEGEKYAIYNHARHMRFTGNVMPYYAHNMHSDVDELWLEAEVDESPAIEHGVYVPYAPGQRVTLLPHMDYEPFVDRPLANAHIEALRCSVAPFVAEAFMPNLHPQPSPLQKVRTQFAHLALLH